MNQKEMVNYFELKEIYLKCFLAYLLMPLYIKINNIISVE